MPVSISPKTGISIGGAIGSGTANSVLYIDGSGNLAQLNPGFTFDGTNLSMLGTMYFSTDTTRYKILKSGTNLRLYGGNNSYAVDVDSSGWLMPTSDNAQDIGSDTIKWRTLKAYAWTAGNGSIQYPSINFAYNTSQGFYSLASQQVGLSLGNARCVEWLNAGGSADDTTTYYNYTSTADRENYRVTYGWSDTTDATRKGRVVFNIYDTAIHEALRIEADGTYALNAFGGSVIASTVLSLYIPTATYTGIVLRAASSQSGNLQEWQNSGGTGMTLVQSAGSLRFGNNISGIETNAGRIGARLFDNFLDIVGIAATASSSSSRIVQIYDILQCGRFQTSPSTGFMVFDRASITDGIYFGENGDTGDVYFRGGGRVTFSPNGDQFDGRFLIAANATTDKILALRGIASQTGVVLQLQGQSSTTVGREQVDIDTTWATSTDASRKARGIFRVWDTAAREAMRIEASGSAAMIGFLGASAVVQQSGEIGTGLVNLGLFSSTFGQKAFARSTAQTGAVASVATYTLSAADASFFISSNINVTAYTAGTVTVQCDYTDETNTARTFTFTFSNLTGTLSSAIGTTGPYEGFPAHIRCKASTAMTIKTTVSIFTGTYNVEGYITQIG